MIVRCVRIFQNYLALRPELASDPLGQIHVGDEFEVKAIVGNRTQRSVGIELPNEGPTMCSIEMFEVVEPHLPEDWEVSIDVSELVFQPARAAERITREGNQPLW